MMKKYIGVALFAIILVGLLLITGAGRRGVAVAGAAQVAASRPATGEMQEFAAVWSGPERSGAGTMRFAGVSIDPNSNGVTHLLPVEAWPTAEAETALGYTPRAGFGLAGESVPGSTLLAPTPAPTQVPPAEVATASAPLETSSIPGGSGVAQRRPAPGDYNLEGLPSISVATIERVLRQYNSPAVGSGQAFYDLGVKYGVDPAFILAFYVHESAAGTAGAAVATKSVGNIICAGWEGSCIGRFRAYDSYVQAAEDWYQLITGPLYIGAGLTTPAEITPRYAPGSDCVPGFGCNDEAGYARTVERLVDQWRAEQP